MDRLDTLGTKGTALKAMKCLSNHSPFPFPFPFLFFFPFFFPFPFPIMFILKIVSKPKSQAWFKVFHYSLLRSVQEIQGGTTQEFSLQFYYVTFFFFFFLGIRFMWPFRLSSICPPWTSPLVDFSALFDRKSKSLKKLCSYFYAKIKIRSKEWLQFK